MLHLLVKSIVRCRLIDRQSHFVETRDLHNAATSIRMNIVVAKVRHHLTQSYHVCVSGRILGKIVLEYGHLLVGRRLATFAVESGSVSVAHKEIVMDPGTKRSC